MINLEMKEGGKEGWSGGTPAGSPKTNCVSSERRGWLVELLTRLLPYNTQGEITTNWYVIEYCGDTVVSQSVKRCCTLQCWYHTYTREKHITITVGLVILYISHKGDPFSSPPWSSRPHPCTHTTIPVSYDTILVFKRSSNNKKNLYSSHPPPFPSSSSSPSSSFTPQFPFPPQHTSIIISPSEATNDGPCVPRSVFSVGRWGERLRHAIHLFIVNTSHKVKPTCHATGASTTPAVSHTTTRNQKPKQKKRKRKRTVNYCAHRITSQEGLVQWTRLSSASTVP